MGHDGNIYKAQPRPDLDDRCGSRPFLEATGRPISRKYGGQSLANFKKMLTSTI